MIRTVILACLVALVVSATVIARDASPQLAPPAEAPQVSTPSGKEIFQRKCFQCHPGTMWGSLRGDRKAWLGVIYRMVGQRALWTEEEINAMADFLAQTRGPK